MTRLEEQSRTREQNAQYLTSLLREIPGASADLDAVEFIATAAVSQSV